jgi:hypothetical protein
MNLIQRESNPWMNVLISKMAKRRAIRPGGIVYSIRATEMAMPKNGEVLDARVRGFRLRPVGCRP